MTHQTYTQEEITSALSKLTIDESDLINQRKIINSQIREKRKSIEFCKNLDTRQYKAF